MSLEIGARVRTRARATGRHTRLPGYLQRKPGVVVGHLGSFPFSDERAAGAKGVRSEPLYTIRFRAADIWEEGAPEHDTICADLFEAYLEGDR